MFFGFTFLMLAMLINPLSLETNEGAIVLISVLGSVFFGIGVYYFANFLYVVLNPQQEKVENKTKSKNVSPTSCCSQSEPPEPR